MKTLLCFFALIILSGCTERWVEVPDGDGVVKSSADARATRRAYDGAPPVIPHIPFGTSCDGCHKVPEVAVGGVGLAPPSPHQDTKYEGRTVRCKQCHVFGTNRGVFAENSFTGFEQNLDLGARLSLVSPPTIPHHLQLRENCNACHAGPAAREEIRTTHPERTRCRQCHAAVSTRDRFRSALGSNQVVEDESATGSN